MSTFGDFRELVVKSVGKPDARNGHVRFDERGRETTGCHSVPVPRPSSTLPYETSALFSARRCFASVHSDVLKAPFASAKLRRKGTKSGGHFSHICSCAAQNACSGLAAVIGPGCRQVNELSPFGSGRFGLRRFLCLRLP